MEGPTQTAHDETMAVNINAGGKVHRLSANSAAMPYEKRRTHCGWRAGSAVAKTMFCKRVIAGYLCRKCFRDHSHGPSETRLEEAIEEPDWQ